MRRCKAAGVSVVSDADYSHGFLVPLLSAYLIWQRRDKLSQIAKRPSAWGMVVVLISLGFLFIGSLGAENSLTRLSMLGTICGLIVYFAGSAILRAMAFPIAFLLLRFPYRVWSTTRSFSHCSSWLPDLPRRAGDAEPVSDHARGQRAYLAPHALEVVEACSGIASLMSLLALAAVMDI